MAKLLKLRRGTTSQHSSFTGAEGECTVDTTKDTLVVHDNSTAGGRPLLREDLNNIGTGVVTHAMLAGDCIDGDNLADNACNSEHYTDTSIQTAHIADDAITADKIADNTITATQLAADSVGYSELAVGAVGNENLAADAVSSGKMADSSVATAALQDDAVTLAKMASGTDGVIITYDASGNPVHVGPGTDGQVLTSTGAGSPPAFEDASGGGATGGSSDKIFFENGQTVTTNYEVGTTFGAACNALSAGPIAINSGVTVTIASGDYWTIV